MPRVVRIEGYTGDGWILARRNLSWFTPTSERERNDAEHEILGLRRERAGHATTAVCTWLTKNSVPVTCWRCSGNADWGVVVTIAVDPRSLMMPLESTSLATP